MNVCTKVCDNPINICQDIKEKNVTVVEKKSGVPQSHLDSSSADQQCLEIFDGS